MTDTPRLILALENGLMLEAVLNTLQQQIKAGFSAEVHLLCEEPAELELPDSFDPSWPTHHPEQFRCEPQDILLLASDASSLRACVEQALSVGAHVVDLSRQWVHDPRAMVVDAEALSDLRLPSQSGALLVLPEPEVLQLLALLRPLAALLPLQSVMVTVMQPAAAGGQRAVEALARQSAQVLNARGAGELDVFPTQLCFNVLPSSGEIDEHGDNSAELALERRTAALLGLPDLQIEACSLQCGTFFGSGQSVFIGVDDYVSLDSVRSVFDASEQLQIDNSAWYSPSAVQASEFDGHYAVSRLRVSNVRDNWLKCWSVGDSAVKGSVLSAFHLLRFLTHSFN